jgi:predicted nucleic acid-binding protein
MRRRLSSTPIPCFALYLGKGCAQLDIAHVDRVAFLTPEACVTEVERHLPSPLKRRHMDKTLVESVWKLLLEHIQVVPSALYEEREAEAKQRISVRDPNDWSKE